MFYIVIFIIELIALFFLSQEFSKRFSKLLLSMTKNEGLSIVLLAFFFFPGVVVHELAHWLVASLLFVKTGEIEFLPRMQGNTVKLGSVVIFKTDPFRRVIIGLAPLFVGITILVLGFTMLLPQFSFSDWRMYLFCYLVFEIGNTMFSSRKDMEGSLVLVAIAIVLGILVIIYKPMITLPVGLINIIIAIMPMLAFTLLGVVAVDICVLFCLFAISNFRWQHTKPR